MLRLVLIALAVTLPASLAFTQTRAASGFAHSFAPAPSQTRAASGFVHSFAPAPGPGQDFRRSQVIVGGFPHQGFNRFHSPFFGVPYWPGYWPYYEDYGYGPDYQPEETHAAESQPAPVVKNEPLPDPVLLELEGGRWVRVKSFSETAEGAPAPPPAQAADVKPIEPAVLVYRDGHREEVTNYSIIGQALYTRADYWTTGAWTRTIQLADLDVPATLKANQDRGVKFDLPSSPDEVVIRP